MIFALLASLFFGTVSAAQASVPTTFCNGHAYTYVVKTYARGVAHLPLRCGTTSWGFNHVKARWNGTYDANIALTIARGEAVTDSQQDGGSTIYALFDGSCTELFRVIYNSRAYLGTGVTPQGIITAYAPLPIGPAIASAVAPAVSLIYRTDCPIFQRI